MGARAFVVERDGRRYVVLDSSDFFTSADVELTAQEAEELAKQLRDAARQARASAKK